MRIPRCHTAAGKDPFAAVPFASRASRIVNPDGSVVFEMTDVQVPEHWSQVAVDILAQKYFRRAGVPAPCRSCCSPRAYRSPGPCAPRSYAREAAAACRAPVKR